MKVKISQYSQENTYGGVSFLKKKQEYYLTLEVKFEDDPYIWNDVTCCCC